MSKEVSNEWARPTSASEHQVVHLCSAERHAGVASGRAPGGTGVLTRKGRYPAQDRLGNSHACFRKGSMVPMDEDQAAERHNG